MGSEGWYWEEEGKRRGKAGGGGWAGKGSKMYVSCIRLHKIISQSIQ